MVSSVPNKEKLTLIAVFAHPDDEVGAIGTLIKHRDAGDDVYVILLTYGENASTFEGTKEEIKERRKEHVKRVEQLLDIKYKFLGLPDSAVFPSVDNAKKLASMFKELKPDIIITWNQSVNLGIGHPDHRYTYNIVLDAISYARYKNENDVYPPHRERISLYTTHHADTPITHATVFVDVTSQYKKILKFIDIYNEAYGGWNVKSFKLSMMELTGRMCGVPYAERFTRLTWRRPQDYLD